MKDVPTFIAHHRVRLLEELDKVSAARPRRPSALALVDRVLDDWAAIPLEHRQGAADEVERAFWCALYTLEELSEHPASDRLLPYEHILMDTLLELREVLRAGNPLPPAYYAVRPGELPV